VANESYDVFISYSRLDSRHATDIDSILRAKGLRSFFDRRNLAPGLPWVRALEQAIGAAKAAIVLIGPHGLGDTQQYERELAFIRQSREPTFPVVPVMLPGTTSDPPFDFLRILTWIDFSQVAKVSDAPLELERLLTAIHGEPVSGEVVRQAICPYRGLDAFREEDSAFFFGRGSTDDPNSPIGELVRKVREQPFVMVVGRSGSGKSSLIYAGLLPALRRERDRFWNILPLRPGPSPLRALAATFNPRTETEGAAEYATKITNEADQLRTGDPELLSHMIRQVLDQAEGKPDRLLLYIDQWEELYAQSPSSSDKERAAQHAADVNRFIDLLLNASQTAPVAVVGTVRADFYDPLIGHPQIRALLQSRQVLLAAMSRSELESTIIEPANKVGLTFDPPGLVQQILDEAGEDEGMLPLLQYALKESWALRKDHTITANAYARSGGVREAIRTTAERTFDALSPEDQQAARQLFLRLVTPGEGKEDTRARAAMPIEPTQRRIVDQFAGPRTRLLVTGSDRAARPIVEVAHEALIRTWPRLREWIDTNREKLRARAAVLQAKAEWEQQARRQDCLLPAGFQLERARALLADPGDLAVGDIQEFITLSSARETRRQRFTRWAVAAVAAAIVIALGTIGYVQADRQKQLAKEELALAVEREHSAALNESLNKRQVELDHAQANILAELSGTKLSRHELDAALRLASQGTRIDITSNAMKGSQGVAALAAAASQANWRLVFGREKTSIVGLSPDGSRIVTASSDKTAHIWDAATGKEMAVLRGHEEFVIFAAFSLDGSRIVTTSPDKTARIWDAATAKEIAVLRGHERILWSAAFSPDGSRIVTASYDGTARIWDVATAKQIAVLPGPQVAVWSAAFSPDGSRIVTALGEDNTARIFNAATTDEVAVLSGHEAFVKFAAFSSDGSRIVTASWDKTARIWDATTAKEIAVLRGHGGAVVFAAFSLNGSRIVTGSEDGTARIWDAATGKEIAVLRGHESKVDYAAFSPDGSRILTSSYDGTARIWDTTTADTKQIAVLRGHDGPVVATVFSPNGSRILTGSDFTVRIWDAATAKEITVLGGRDSGLTSAALSPDWSRIVTGSTDKTARIWDAATAKEIAVLRGHEGAVKTAEVSRDGSRIVTGSMDKTARIWDAATAKEVAVLRGHEGYVTSVTFSPDGSRIVTGSSDNTARIWDAATAKEIAVLRDYGAVGFAAFSRDGSRIMTGSDFTVRIWDAATAKEITGMMVGYPVWSAAFSPDGSRIITAAGENDTIARIWDAATGKEMAVLRGHEGSVTFAQFSSDGSHIVTGSMDKTARIWDAATAKEVAVLRGHEDYVTSARFSPDGARIVTSSHDGTARVWDARLQTMSVKDLLAEACAHLTGLTKLTREEMRLASYPENMPEIDVCIDTEKVP
jgi:WD40 repeat protein